VNAHTYARSIRRRRRRRFNVGRVLVLNTPPARRSPRPLWLPSLVLAGGSLRTNTGPSSNHDLPSGIMLIHMHGPGSSEIDASACIRRHQALAPAPVRERERERRFRVYTEAPGFRPGPRWTRFVNSPSVKCLFSMTPLPPPPRRPPPPRPRPRPRVSTVRGLAASARAMRSAGSTTPLLNVLHSFPHHVR